MKSRLRWTDSNWPTSSSKSCEMAVAARPPSRPPTIVLPPSHIATGWMASAVQYCSMYRLREPIAAPSAAPASSPQPVQRSVGCVDAFEDCQYSIPPTANANISEARWTVGDEIISNDHTVTLHCQRCLLMFAVCYTSGVLVGQARP